MVTDIRGEHESEWAAMGRVARLPGTGVKLSFANKWVGAVAAITVTAALAVTAFVVHVSGSYGRLRWAGSSTSQSMNSAHAGPAGTTWVFGSYNPCVTANPVTVTGIKFTKSSGLAMTGWGHKSTAVGKSAQPVARSPRTGSKPVLRR